MGDVEDESGFYAVLGRIMIPGQTRDGVLVAAVIPQGHTAPIHQHQSRRCKPGCEAVAGEITVTFSSSPLRYKVAGAGTGIAELTRDDAPRISAPKSIDIYEKQEGGHWVGLYMQPHTAETDPAKFETA